MTNPLLQSKLIGDGLWLTPMARLSWPKLSSPEPKPGGDQKKLFYSATLIFGVPLSDGSRVNAVDIVPIVEAMKTMAVEKFGVDKRTNQPRCHQPDFHWCLRDESYKTSQKTGEVLAGYDRPGTWTLSSSSLYQPRFLSDRNEFIAAEEIDRYFYAGAIVRGQIRLYDYHKNTQNPQKKEGIGSALLALQFVGHGERFGGSSFIPDAFDLIDESSIPD